jgi:hypothetical protein
MKRNRYITILGLILCIECLFFVFGLGCVRSGRDTRDAKTGRFMPLDIYVDSGNYPLAAYQIEIEDTSMVSVIVGIEGGEHHAFREPPYYDSAAIDNYRVILASFSMNSRLPTGRTRVATIHLLVHDRDGPGFILRRCITADPNGRSFAADVILALGEES